jgi:hypothetical protein
MADSSGDGFVRSVSTEGRGVVYAAGSRTPEKSEATVESRCLVRRAPMSAGKTDKVRAVLHSRAHESATERRNQARGKVTDKRGLHVGAAGSQWAAQIKGKLGRIGWFRPNRAQHPFSFIFSFSFLFSLIFESKFAFQICDELVLKFSEYMICINHCGINLSIYKFYFCIA